MAEDVPRFQVGPFADDLTRFVGAVFGYSRFRLVPPDDSVAKDEKLVAILEDEEHGEIRVAVDVEDEPTHPRTTAGMQRAQNEADSAIADYFEEMARIKRAEEAASEQIEDAHNRIKQAEYDLAEAKHALRSLEHDRSNARTRYWLEMDTIAAFGKRER